MIEIDAISDLHGYEPPLPGGDLLIIAGDLVGRDTEKEYKKFDEWLGGLKYDKIIVVGGNHDVRLSRNRQSMDTPFKNAEYLCDSGTEYKGVKIWGTPWSLWFEEINPKCAAFTGSEKDLAERYRDIPENTDILISHSPMYGILDRVDSVRNCGSYSLQEAVDRILPDVLIHGHIHEHGGESVKYIGVHVFNVSYVDERYRQRTNGLRRLRMYRTS